MAHLLTSPKQGGAVTLIDHFGFFGIMLRLQMSLLLFHPLHALGEVSECVIPHSTFRIPTEIPPP